MYGCFASIYVSALHVCCTVHAWGRKKVPDFQELNLYMVESSHVGTKNWIQVFWKDRQCHLPHPKFVFSKITKLHLKTKLCQAQYYTPIIPIVLGKDTILAKVHSWLYGKCRTKSPTRFFFLYIHLLYCQNIMERNNLPQMPKTNNRQ